MRKPQSVGVANYERVCVRNIYAVCELTDGLIKDAVARELSRNGQVFILFNRVGGIENFAKRVSALVPEAKVDYAHGRMSAEQLEDKIGRFYSKEYNVLVSTIVSHFFYVSVLFIAEYISRSSYLQIAQNDLDKLIRGVEENYGAMPTGCRYLFELSLIRNLALVNLLTKTFDAFE